MVHSRIENRLRKQGYRFIAGVDEAGRGPLAGPVFSAAVIFHPGTYIRGLDDSKKLSPRKRERLYKEIFKKAAAVGVGMSDVKTIDKVNILQASLLSMKKAVFGLEKRPDLILVDGNTEIPQIDIAQRTVIGGDGISSSVAAASIIAKVTRDMFMRSLHEKYPRYGFDRHKGYGTKQHFKAIGIFGPCDAHRKTFL